MPDTSPLTDSKIKTLEAHPVSEMNTGKKVYSFEKIKQNFEATFECRDSIRKALKDAWHQYHA